MTDIADQEFINRLTRALKDGLKQEFESRIQSLEQAVNNSGRKATLYRSVHQEQLRAAWAIAGIILASPLPSLESSPDAKIPYYEWVSECAWDLVEAVEAEGRMRWEAKP